MTTIPFMAKVYISSTKTDLDQERQTLVNALVAANHQPQHSYSTSDHPLTRSCEADVEATDIYVLLLGRRYGYRPPQDNPERLSITHLEFRAAKRFGKPTVILIQGRPPMDLSDHDQNRMEDEASRVAFWDEVRARVRPGQWNDEASLTTGVLIGVQKELEAARIEAEKARQAKEFDKAPAITPGQVPPHARVLAHSLLLVQPAGADNDTARRLAETLEKQAIGWKVEVYPWAVEDGLDWRIFDQSVARSRAVALLLTPSAPRFTPQLETLREMMEFSRRQCGFVAGLRIGAAGVPMPWLPELLLNQVHDLDAWHAAPQGTITEDLSRAIQRMRGEHRDLDDPRLVGLQCVVVAMTQDEAKELRDDPGKRGTLTPEQQEFLQGTLDRAANAKLDWIERYGPRREDWQPFGARQGGSRALEVLREVVNDINVQEVTRPREQEALKGHRIRLRPYQFEPVVAGTSPRLRMMRQVMDRRMLVLVDELSLCHEKVRRAAQAPLSNPRLAVATVAPFDPPSFNVEEALESDRIPQFGGFRDRFLVDLDPNCELNLASTTRLMRWLRLVIPETLTAEGGVALQTNRASFREEAGL